MAQRSGISDLPVFGVSARLALRGKLTGAAQMITDSGLLELERALVSFLHTRKACVLLTRVSDEVKSLLKEQTAALERAVRVAGHPEQRTVADQALRAKAAQVRNEQDRILATVAPRLGSELVERFDSELGDWHKTVHGELFERLKSFLRSADLLTLLAGAPCFIAALSAACEERTRAWLVARREELQRVIVDSAADYAVALDRAAAEVFDEGWSGWIRPESARTTFERVPLALPQAPSFQWRFAMRWWIYALPLRSVKQYVLRQCSIRLEQALFAHVEAIRSCLRVIAGNGWTRSGSKLTEDMSAVISRAEIILRTEPEPTERAVLDDLLAKLDQVRSLTATFDDEINSEDNVANSRASSSHHLEEGAKNNTLASCAICARLEGELFRFMSNRSV